MRVARFSFVKPGIKHSASTTLNSGCFATVATVVVSYGEIVIVGVQTAVLSINVVRPLVMTNF